MRRLMVAAGLVAIGGCEGSPARDPGFWRPWYEPAAVGSAGGESAEEPEDTPTPTPMGMGDGPPATTPPAMGTAACGLAVTVTTASFGGAYAPSNIGAIWIADERDHFVKTLAVWADRRREHLDRWVAATAAAGVPGSRLDAVSTATRTSHGQRSARWDCSDVTRAPVADGNYRVCFELTESNGAGPLDCVAFVKGGLAQDLAPADRPTFKRRHLVFTP